MSEMSEWTPKVGDKVMVGEHGPYEVEMTAGAGQMTGLAAAGVMRTWVPTAWLTPTPEPEPDEPTAPGALVRDGEGNLLVCVLTSEQEWLYLPSGATFERWAGIQRPITVVLADPAEVEQLRDQVEGLVSALAQQTERGDELQRRIGRGTAYAYEQQAKGEFISSYHLDSILRGES